MTKEIKYPAIHYAISYSLQPVPRSVLITPDNVGNLATTLSSTLVIGSRSFRFGAGTTNEVLLVVPLVGPGELGPSAQIQITVGLDSTGMNLPRDEDPRFGITDGTNKNLFWIVDKGNYHRLAPCYPVSGSHDDQLVATSTRVSDQFTLLFQPSTKFGACYTAQLGGYVNSARFTPQISVNAGISLQVERNGAAEQYTFHYIKVDLYYTDLICILAHQIAA